MSKTYVRPILPNTIDSHQTSPGYVVTFIRWSNRDTINYEESADETRRPLVVINDCVELQVTNSKSNITSSFSGVFKAGDINYSTAVHPGDYVIVNMVNQEKKVWDIYERALSEQPINEFYDGFKGLFKVQTVRRRVETNPQTGAKSHYFVVHGFGFTEMQAQLYYDPVIASLFSESEVLFISQFGKYWAEIANSYQNTRNVQEILISLFKSLLGTGLKNKDMMIPPTQNRHFKVPGSVGKLLGRSGGGEQTIPDIYNFLFGIWGSPASTKYTKGSENTGFNPSAEKNESDNNFFTLGSSLEGWRLLAPENFNQKTIWSVIQSYLNGVVNEIYTTYRVSPENNRRIYPTIVCRQKPFSSEHYKSPKDVGPVDPDPKPYTAFMSLPRWRVSSDLIYSIDLGKDEAARINFVQIYGRSVAASDPENRAKQIGSGNFFYDEEDIKRHGLKPFVSTSNFDFPSPAGGNENQARNWAYLSFDMLNAGQLRESGVIQCVGIEQPISVGDNLEFDNSVYHIEQVSHVMRINPEGFKAFRTTIMLSFGTEMASSKTTPVYPQMEHTASEQERIRDYKKEGILPGVSDTQDIKGREKGENVKGTKEKSFTGAGVKATGMDRMKSFEDKTYNDKDEK